MSVIINSEGKILGFTTMDDCRANKNGVNEGICHALTLARMCIYGHFGLNNLSYDYGHYVADFFFHFKIYQNFVRGIYIILIRIFYPFIPSFIRDILAFFVNLSFFDNFFFSLYILYYFLYDDSRIFLIESLF